MQVFVFHGVGSQFANAVFSTQSKAEAWISLHQLTGLLTKYDLDTPAFDRHLRQRSLPRDIRKAISRGESTMLFAQEFVDGAWHAHYYYGLGSEAPGFDEAFDRWHRDNGYPNA